MFVKLTQKHSFIVHRLKKKQRNWIINNKYGRMDCKLYFSSKSGKKTKKRGWKKNKEKRSMSSRWCEFSQISRVSRGSRRIWCRSECRSEDALGGGGDRVRKRLPLGLPSTWNSATINASGGCCPPPLTPDYPNNFHLFSYFFFPSYTDRIVSQFLFRFPPFPWATISIFAKRKRASFDVSAKTISPQTLKRALLPAKRFLFIYDRYFLGKSIIAYDWSCNVMRWVKDKRKINKNQTGRQTDRQTDRPTDGIFFACFMF